jgi:HK97 gp10 family phage protein
MARLNDLADDLKKDIAKEALTEGAKIVQRSAAANAWGSVAQAIEIEVDATEPIPKAKIGPNKDHWYAVFQEFGAKRHVIKVDVKTVLSDGSDVFGREVNHPGVRKKPFLRPALDDNLDEIKRKIGDVIARRLGAG